MEDRVHVRALDEGIEQGAGNVTHAFGNDPPYSMGTDRIYQRLESHQHYQSHQYIANGFPMIMFLELAETHDGTGNGAEPHETEQGPAPLALFAQGYQRDGGVAPCNVPVDGRMIPFAVSFSPLAGGRTSMIHR